MHSANAALDVRTECVGCGVMSALITESSSVLLVMVYSIQRRKAAGVNFFRRFSFAGANQPLLLEEEMQRSRLLLVK